MSHIDCLDCKTVISDTSGSLGGPITFTDPITGLSQQVSLPDFEPGELAKYDDLFFIKCSDSHGTGDVIKKFIITSSNCSVQKLPQSIFLSAIPFGALTTLGVTYTGNGMCAKNSTTLIIGSVSLSSGSNWICEVDISSPVALITPLFQAGGFVNGDIVYIPSTNTIVATIDIASGVTEAFHYDMTGNVLGQSNINILSGISPESMFSKNDEVFICTNSTVFNFDLTNYTLTPSILANPAGIGVNDAASSPAECDPIEFCYEIGDISDPANGGAGGIIFALPYTGLNQTPFYYEVALNDISTSTTPTSSIAIDDIAPFSQFYNPTNGQLTCGTEISPLPQAKFGFPPSGNVVYPVDATIGNTRARYTFGPNTWPDPYNPSGPPSISSILIGSSTNPTPVIGTDFYGNSVWPSQTTNPVLVSITFIPAGVTSIPGTSITVQALQSDSYLFQFNAPMSNTTSVFFLKELIILGGPSPGYQPYSNTGAEWGHYMTPDALVPTSVKFGTGHNNTLNFTTSLTSAVFPTHDVAANLCNNYLFGGQNDWFLPSLMEFHELFSKLGTTLNFNEDVDKSEDIYWTSSAITGKIQNPASTSPSNLIIGGPNTISSYPFAWTYKTAYTQQPSVGPHVMKRCSTFSVRPIRRFECTPVPVTPEEVFNWVDDVQYIQSKWEQEVLGPATGMSLPGLAGSSWSPFECTGPHFADIINHTSNYIYTTSTNPTSMDPNLWVDAVYEFDAVIGGNEFRLSFSLTDVAGNQYTASDFSDSNNPEGYTFKMWTADKVFLGEWHYQNCEVLTFGTNPPEVPHLYEDFNNEPWFDPLIFPKRIALKFTNVTHKAGDFPVTAYGFYDSQWGQDEVRAKYVSGDAIYTKPNPGATLIGPGGDTYTRSHWKFINDGPKFHYLYENEYQEGTFQGTTASYSFIQFRCKMADAKTIPLPDVYNGPNTTTNGKNVVCLKEVMDNVKSYPGQNELGLRTGGHIGVGWEWTRYYGGPVTFNVNQGNQPHNTNIYGSYNIPGTSIQLENPLPNINGQPFGDWDDHPKHFLYAWHAVFAPPTATTITLYDNLLEGLNSGCTYGCNYDVGDIGPSGGIIVATPYMNVNNSSAGIVGPVVAPLQGNVFLENPTEFYFELSPNNINFYEDYPSGQFPQWGSCDIINNIQADIQNDPIYSDLNIPDLTIYDSTTFYYPSSTPGVSLINYPSSPNPNWIMEQVGQGKVVHDAMIAVNNGNPVTILPNDPGNYYNAFEACENYELQEFDDWFLPNIGEMEFARNYTPPGTLINTLAVPSSGGYNPVISWNDYTGQAYQSDTTYWTSNSFAFGTDTYDPPNNLFPLNLTQTNLFNSTGGAVYNPPPTPGSAGILDGCIVPADPLFSSNPINTPTGPDWRYLSLRINNHNIRAMRRFTCPPPVFSLGSDKYTWSLCGFKDIGGQVGFFSTPWVAGALYNQGPVVMDHLGFSATGDDLVTDIQTVLGAFLIPGEVIEVDFSPALPNGISKLYIKFEGLGLQWDESLNITGLLAAPVTTVNYILYPNCGSALGASITDPDVNSFARLTAPTIELQSKLNIKEKAPEQVEDKKIEKLNNEENDKRTY